MSEHANTREKRLAALAVAVVVLVTVLLIVETLSLIHISEPTRPY